MRVLLIHDGAGPLRGSEKVALDLMQGLRQRGYVWQVFTNHPEFHQAADAAGFPAELSHFKRLFVDGAAPMDWIQAWRCMRRVRQLIRDHGLQLVHINNGGACQWAIPAAALQGIPSVVHLHAPWSRKMRLLLGLHHTDRIVGVSRAILSRFDQDPVAAAKTRVIYNGIRVPPDPLEIDRANLRRTLGLRPDQFSVGVIGVLVKGKRTADAVSAMRILMRDHVDRCVLLVIGDGEEREQLESLAAGLPVRFLGQRSDVPTLMSSVCDAIVLPSKIEAFSLVLLEAAIYGVPRIASDAGGNVESILHMEDGLVVPLGDTEAIAAAVARLMDDPPLARRLTRRARERALNDFSEKTFLDGFDALYAQALALRPIRRLAKLLSMLRSNFHLLFTRESGPVHHVQD